MTPRVSITRRRFNAAILDSILLVVPGLGAHFYDMGVAVFAVALTLVYFQLSEATTGQTVGKSVFKVRVVTLDGKIAGDRAIAARTILRLFPFALVDFILVFCNASRRRLGDFAAGTVVVDAMHPVQTRPLTLGLLGYPTIWLIPALVVCILSVQGHFPGSYRYAVDTLCERVDAVATEAQSPAQLASLTRHEALALAAIRPPLNWKDRHDALVAEYMALSRHLQDSVALAMSSRDRAKVWNREWAALVRHSRRSNRRLAQLGYRGCAGETSAA